MSNPTTPLTCRELVELVTDYVEGVLPAPERARFEEHTDCCGWCVKYVAQIRETIAVVGRVDEGAVDPEVEGHMMRVFRDWKSGQS